MNTTGSVSVYNRYRVFCEIASLMLWSQIKLTSYDFSDLHITGEFDNRPGTGRFFRNLY